MHCGEHLDRPVLAYETWGELNARRDNAVLLFTGLSPSAHAASSAEVPVPGWWEAMIGPSRPIDTGRYFVICMNSMGSCFGSTGPASENPETGQPYRLSFPELRLEDVAEAGRSLIRHLGIEVLHTVIGPSMGGMTALALSVLHPGISRRLVVISAAAQSLPTAIALRSVQREMIRRDPDWQHGNYPPGGGPVDGIRLARKLGMVTYRSAAEWNQRFGRRRAVDDLQADDPFGMRFEVEAYLEAHAQSFTGEFDANCYLYLSRAMDLFDLADYGGSVAAGLGRVKAERSLVMGVKTDFLFPVEQQREIAEGLGGAVELVELDSIQGHDSFLADAGRFAPVLASFFSAP